MSARALRSLLPVYAGRVTCVFIDPPYNTRSAFEHCDDNREHSLWLSMMYPRLELLRELLSEDGSIWDAPRGPDRGQHDPGVIEQPALLGDLNPMASAMVALCAGNEKRLSEFLSRHPGRAYRPRGPECALPSRTRIAQPHHQRVPRGPRVAAFPSVKRRVPLLFARLHGSDFRISAQVIETVLRRVGEMA